MEIYDSRKDELPNNNEYVVARYTGGNWHDADDQEGCIWKVVKFKKLNRLSQNNEHSDNIESYCWVEFGPGRISGQDVDLWFRLPRGIKYER